MRRATPRMPAEFLVMLADLKVALVFLTRLPVPIGGTVAMRDLARTVHLWPVVGVAVGAAGGAAFWLAARLDLPPVLCACMALGVTIALTGALHEDGLADTADALGAGPDRERALAIMRDSRIGTFGAVALILTIVARLGVLTGLAHVERVAPALIAAAAVSRAVLPVVMLTQPGARASGLAAAVGTPEPFRVWLAVAMGIAVPVVVLPDALAVAGLVSAAVVATVTALALTRRFGGCTGDTLGAVQQAAEIAFLIALARP